MCAVVQNKPEHQKAPNFSERRRSEVRRTPLSRSSEKSSLRTPLNKGDEKGRSPI